MPAKRLPSYCHHKPTSQAYVRLDGKMRYLGVYGSEESREEYKRLLDKWLRKHRGQRLNLTVDQLSLQYLDFAGDHYQKAGEPTSRLHVTRLALRYAVAVHGSTLAADFGPVALKECREKMIDDGLARSTINDLVSCIRRIFRWGVENEYVSVEVWQALQAVPGLHKGRTKAKETGPVAPVAEEHVNVVLPYLSRQVRDMVRVQLLTGCRPSEVCILRPCDIDRSGDVWLYRPQEHKGEHHDRDRIVFVGPRAQEILAPWLEDRPADAFCFSPAEAEAERRTK